MFELPSSRIAIFGAASMRRLIEPVNAAVATCTAVVLVFCQLVMMVVALDASAESITKGPPR
jgi:hypothetical protein